VPDFYHRSQADYNVYCTTVNLSYVMNINVVGLLGGPQLASMTWGLWDEVGEGGGAAPVLTACLDVLCS